MQQVSRLKKLLQIVILYINSLLFMVHFFFLEKNLIIRQHIFGAEILWYYVKLRNAKSAKMSISACLYFLLKHLYSMKHLVRIVNSLILSF